MADAAGAVSHGATAQEPATVFSSLAIGALVDQLGQRRDCCVLDLGRGFGANVEFLSQFSSKIYIEDLFQTLTSTGLPFVGGERIWSPAYNLLLPYHTDTRFDLILLWNLLDYLDRDDIGRLAAHIRRYCQWNTMVYALISTRQKIPATPTNFKIVDRNNLLYQYTTAAQRDCPRYRQVGLLDLLRGFRVKRSFLLRNGMQEYLFETGAD